MSKLSIILTAFILTIAFFILPTAQAANIELSDTCSLADAITAANTDKAVGECPAGDGADTIKLSGSITLDAALPHITSEITIEGGGVTISGKNHFRIFAVNGGTLTVNDLTMTRGFAGWGGAIVNVNNGTLIINNSHMSNNWASEGGAIGNDSTVIITNSEITSNSAEKAGALHNSGGTVNISSGLIKNNSSEWSGGAIFSEGGTLQITDSNFSNNKTRRDDAYGGAMYIEDGLVVISSSTFTENVCDGNGGAILSDDGELWITSSSFLRNSSSWKGGAINCDDCELQIAGSQIRHNTAENGGGGVSTTGTTTISSSVISHNKTKRGGRFSEGGGVHALDQLEITGSTISNNTAEQGGGIYTLGRLKINNSHISSNVAVDEGGGLYILVYGATLTHVTMVSNQAKRGGGLYRDTTADDINLHNTIIAGSKRGGDCFGRLNENVNNLIEDGSCFPTLMGDPMLGELVEPYDGSPAYYPLLEGSPAIDVADGKHCPKTDQVGTKRPQGAGCDISAYELPTAIDN